MIRYYNGFAKLGIYCISIEKYTNINKIIDILTYVDTYGFLKTFDREGCGLPGIVLHGCFFRFVYISFAIKRFKIPRVYRRGKIFYVRRE